MNDDLNPQTWLDAHGDYLYSYVFLKVKDRHVAEDLVQEMLLAALTANENFNNRSCVRTWLTGILKHKMVDYFRRQGRVIFSEKRCLD
ncbi:sigma factor [Nitrosomonas marina]|uniref:RNA polymerase sigma-70 factor, ECF subfamily n=1 Tax=Nitrosomonas marina TaxID=917 RepID=A0A1H8BDA7_9PROT|nr:sigma factor [Nitrosomonas marina]SEM80736.1 RNA polymerase sigma-70 factor, ECF subfamily [Nitrosomonas marina]